MRSCLARSRPAVLELDTHALWTSRFGLERGANATVLSAVVLLGSSAMWKTLIDEAQEIAWLATVIGALSVAGVGVAVVLAGA